MKRFVSLVLLSWLASGGVFGADASKKELDQKAAELENLLIAPCCWRQPVAVHFSPASDEVRAEIRELLAQGRSREEILDRFVAEYGERILSKPPARGFGSLAYFLPFIFLAGGAAVATVVIRRLRPEKSKEAGRKKSSGKDKDYSARLEKELWG